MEIDRKIEEAKAKGVDVISLGVGDPDLPTPEIVVKAAQEAVADPQTHNYPPYQGTKEYRASVTNWMQNRFGVTVDPTTEVLATIGSKEAIAHIIATYIEPGDVVLCPSPGYPVYENYTLLVGGTPVTLPLHAENGFLPDLSVLDAETLKKAKILFLNYPNNPTGAIISEEDIKGYVDFCREHDILLCHDHAYSEMTFEGYRAPSFLSIEGAKDVCIEFFSLSKMYNMTGWRAGFVTGNADAIKALGTVKNNIDSGIFKALQRACCVALDNSEELIGGLNETYGRRRNLVIKGLNELGWDYAAPAATFYLWVPLPDGIDSTDFASLLLEECGVIVTPGIGYGSAGEGFFRVALTLPDERLQEVIDRLKEAGITYSSLSEKLKAA